MLQRRLGLTHHPRALLRTARRPRETPTRAVKLVRFGHAATVCSRVEARHKSRPTPATPTNPTCIETSRRSPGPPPRPWRAFTGATPATVAGEPFLAVDPLARPGRGTIAKPHVPRDLRLDPHRR